MVAGIVQHFKINISTRSKKVHEENFYTQRFTAKTIIETSQGANAMLKFKQMHCFCTQIYTIVCYSNPLLKFRTANLP
jgi:hypothetical protein